MESLDTTCILSLSLPVRSGRGALPQVIYIMLLCMYDSAQRAELFQ